jgi:hypothetical protein
MPTNEGSVSASPMEVRSKPTRSYHQRSRLLGFCRAHAVACPHVAMCLCASRWVIRCQRPTHFMPPCICTRARPPTKARAFCSKIAQHAMRPTWWKALLSPPWYSWFSLGFSAISFLMIVMEMVTPPSALPTSHTHTCTSPTNDATARPTPVCLS